MKQLDLTDLQTEALYIYVYIVVKKIWLLESLIEKLNK